MPLCGQVPRRESEQFFVIHTENTVRFSKVSSTCSVIKHCRNKLILNVRLVAAFLNTLNSMVSVTCSSSSAMS